MHAKYVIRELSAIAVMMNAVLNEDGRYTFYLDEETTRRCIVPSAPKTQDDCPLYYQIMSVLHGKYDEWFADIPLHPGSVGQHRQRASLPYYP